MVKSLGSVTGRMALSRALYVCVFVAPWWYSPVQLQETALGENEESQTRPPGPREFPLVTMVTEATLKVSNFTRLVSVPSILDKKKI